MIQLEHGYTKLFTSTVEGVGTAADSTPAAVLYRNGSASGVTVTVSTTGTTGLYKATFTTLASGDGWAESDHLELHATATIDSTSGYLALVWSSLELANTAVPLDDTATQSAAASAITAASLALESTAQSILEDTGTTLPASLTAISNSVAAINAGAARYIAILTPAGYEIPDAGSVTVPIEIRTYDADGEPVDLDSSADPTVAIYRASDGTDLSAALSALSNPATGVWRLTYTVASTDAIEPLRIDASGTIDSTSRSTSAYPVVTDAVAVDFTSTDRGKLDAIAAKLPSTDYLLGTSESDGSGYSVFDAANDTVARVTLVDTTTANTDMRGTDSAYTGTPPTAEQIRTEIDSNSTQLAKIGTPSGASMSADIAAVKADTTTLLERITAAAATLFVDLAAMITGSGADPKYTTAALENGASGGGGGGDATEAKQDEILTILAGSPIQSQSAVVSATVIELVQGDTYDGVANPLITWAVEKDYTDGWSATLTIRDAADDVVESAAGSIESETLISVELTAPSGLSMSGCPAAWEGKFDLQMSKGSSRETVARGSVYVYEDQTRA